MYISQRKTIFSFLILGILYTLSAQTYPKLIVTPSSPVTLDSVQIWCVKGQNSNSCVPIFNNQKFTIEQSPLLIYPPIYYIRISYTQNNPPKDVMCAQVLTEYGPRFNFGKLPVGSYTVIDDSVNVGSFSVRDSQLVKTFTIKGTVYDDPYPSKRMSLPIPGTKIIFGKYRYIAASSYGPQFTIIDSVLSNSAGAYSFKPVVKGDYMLRFLAPGFRTRDTIVNLQSDINLNMFLLTDESFSSISGKIMAVICPSNPLMGMPCQTKPLPGCTVTVSLKDCYPGTVSAYFKSVCTKLYGVTDAEGNYLIEKIPHVKNGQRVSVIAGLDGYQSKFIDTTVFTMGNTVVNFELNKSYVIRNTIIAADGVQYQIATEKQNYFKGDSVRAQYIITNRPPITKTYSLLACGWHYSYTASDIKNNELFSYTTPQIYCVVASPPVLQSYQKVNFQLPSFKITKSVDTIILSAMVSQYDETTVKTKLSVSQPVPVSEQLNPEISRKITLHFKNKQLNLLSAQDGIVGWGLYTLSGKEICKFNTVQMKKGYNILSIPSSLPKGTYLFKYSINNSTKWERVNKIN